MDNSSKVSRLSWCSGLIIIKIEYPGSVKKTRLYVCRSEDLEELLYDILEQAPDLLKNDKGSFSDGYLSGIKTALKLIDYVQIESYEYAIEESESMAEA